MRDAGKTTTLEALEGHLARDAREVEVLGRDTARPTLAWRARIGLVLAGALSGGQQRRLDVGLALIGDPEPVCLDEHDVTATLGELLDWARARNIDLAGLTVSRPSLEDTYPALPTWAFRGAGGGARTASSRRTTGSWRGARAAASRVRRQSPGSASRRGPDVRGRARRN